MSETRVVRPASAGDGWDDGEAVVTRVLGVDDGSPTSLFFQGTGAFITLVLLFVLTGGASP